MKASLSFKFLDLCLYIVRVLALVLVLVYIFDLCLYDAQKMKALHPAFCASRSSGLGCCFFLLSFIFYLAFCALPQVDFMWCSFSLLFIYHIVFFIRRTLCGVPFYRITALNGLQQISLHNALQVILEDILHPEFSLKIRMLFTPISKSTFRSPVLKSIPSNVKKIA